MADLWLQAAACAGTSRCSAACCQTVSEASLHTPTDWCPHAHSTGAIGQLLAPPPGGAASNSPLLQPLGGRRERWPACCDGLLHCSDGVDASPGCDPSSAGMCVVLQTQSLWSQVCLLSAALFDHAEWQTSSRSGQLRLCAQELLAPCLQDEYQPPRSSPQ